MSRLVFFAVAMLAMLLGATAQFDSSSSSGMEVDSSSSSSNIIVEISSSSSVPVIGVSSSSSGMEVLSSSSEPFDSSSSSSGEAMSSSGGASIPPFVPANWEDLDVLPDGAPIFVSWGNKSDDNLMINVGTENGFIVNGVSGGAVRLGYGNTYNISIDDIAAPFGFYIDVDPEGNKPNGNITAPIMAPGNYSFTVNATNFATDNQNQVVFLYYASSNTEFAGGAAILGHQSAAALRASIMVMAISAFFALVAPKW